jgi:carboxyl-terminal processing protease
MNLEGMDMKNRLFLLMWAALLSVSVAGADSPPPDKSTRQTRIAAAARQAWAITDLVLEKDIDPPARQQMLLHGLKLLLAQTPGRTIANLSGRVSTVTMPEQFAALLAEAWPKDAPAADADDEEKRPESTLFSGLFLGLREAGVPEDVRGGAYLTPRQVKIHETLVGNRYVGTGIQIRMDAKENLAQIIVPFPGGPARKAGARPGDLIVAVDDQDMKGQSLREFVRRLQGEEGTKVSMTVRHPGESQTRRLPMVRGIIPFTSVHGYRRTGEESWSFRVDPQTEVGYLSLEDIHSSTLLELRHIEPLLREQGVRALVLDLRYSRGSQMRHAALVADGLIDGGILWRVRDAKGKVKEYKADRDCLFRDMPMAVLVGEHTQGMAKVVAASLQDRGRATLVGWPSVGDMREIGFLPLPEGQGALLLRTGKIERVARSEKTAEGALVPDHRVRIERKEVEAVLEWRQAQNSPEPKTDAKPPSDPQLGKAVAVLREALAKREKKGAE